MQCSEGPRLGFRVPVGEPAALSRRDGDPSKQTADKAAWPLDHFPVIFARIHHITKTNGWSELNKRKTKIRGSDKTLKNSPEAGGRSGGQGSPSESISSQLPPVLCFLFPVTEAAPRKQGRAEREGAGGSDAGCRSGSGTHTPRLSQPGGWCTIAQPSRCPLASPVLR